MVGLAIQFVAMGMIISTWLHDTTGFILMLPVAFIDLFVMLWVSGDL